MLAWNSRRGSDWEYQKQEGQKQEGTRSCWNRPEAGEGETEPNRVYYRLGWTQGWYKGALHDKRFGELSHDGQTCDWKAAQPKLPEMARKDDRAA